jgi:hypothetical protein
MADLKELQKTIDEVEDAFLIIGDAHDIAYAAVVKAYDDFNDERNRQDIALRANTEGVGEVFSTNQ